MAGKRHIVRRGKHRLRGGANGADHGPAERWQHSGRAFEYTEHAGVLAARALEENILDRLALSCLITDEQCEAGLRLRADYLGARLEARQIGCYNPARSINNGHDGGYERNEAEEAAYRRWRHAVRAIGIIDSDTIVTVCCHDRAPCAHQLPALLRGLERLLKWYGLRS
ncbi:MAG: hypothetical protein GC131_08955 [Alphaproteobacteria bacterium]|nr:hypothetical protein [Alphaproteobacteria bacterium]